MCQTLNIQCHSWFFVFASLIVTQVAHWFCIVFDKEYGTSCSCLFLLSTFFRPVLLWLQNFTLIGHLLLCSSLSFTTHSSSSLLCHNLIIHLHPPRIFPNHDIHYIQSCSYMSFVLGRNFIGDSPIIVLNRNSINPITVLAQYPCCISSIGTFDLHVLKDKEEYKMPRVQ